MQNNMTGNTALDSIRTDQISYSEVEAGYYEPEKKYPDNPNPEFYAGSLDPETGKFEFILKPAQCKNCYCLYTPEYAGQKECEICR